MLLLENGGRSLAATISSAKTRPRPDSIAICSAGKRVKADRICAKASSTDKRARGLSAMPGYLRDIFVLAPVYLAVNSNVEIMDHQGGQCPLTLTLSPTQAEGKGNAAICRIAPCPLYGGKGVGVRGKQGCHNYHERFYD